MKTQRNNWLIIMLLLGVVLFFSCTKVDRTNPYDDKANLNPDEWAPTNLKIENIDYTTIKLSWEYLDRNIEGFKLDISENGGEWQNSYQSLNKTDRSFIDTAIDTSELNDYEYRLYAFAGVNKSKIISKNYSISKPIVNTTAISSIINSTAISGGNIISDGNLPITARGVCWSISQNPTINDSHSSDGSGLGSFTSNITGLSINSLYYFRAYATNSLGISYGENLSFYTSNVVDIDGNIYNTIEIGEQTWMVVNLKVTHYGNGDPITNITDATQWSGLSTGAYCWYNNDEATYKNVYGALYNYYTVVDSRNLCPIGWHIPTDAEWTLLTNYLGGESVAGGKMKEVGTSHWNSPNTSASNESGFTGLPGGFIWGTYNSIGDDGLWWSSTEGGTSSAWRRYLGYDAGNLNRYNYAKGAGFSVRCVKD